MTEAHRSDAHAPLLGRVLGTEDATPTAFWFLVATGQSVQLDDLVVARTAVAHAAWRGASAVAEEDIRVAADLGMAPDVQRLLVGHMGCYAALPGLGTAADFVAARGRSALLISHRFSTVRMADRILVLEGGRVLESGSHADLQARGGRYAELFELQAAGYR